MLRAFMVDLEKARPNLENLNDEEIYGKIAELAGTCYSFLAITISRGDQAKAAISVSFNETALTDAQAMDGKWLLYATDSSLSAADVVTQYFEKDFVEKVFRCLKTEEDIAPVRHRLEHRVRAYVFICMLAFRLLSMLQALLDDKPKKKLKRKKGRSETGSRCFICPKTSGTSRGETGQSGQDLVSQLARLSGRVIQSDWYAQFVRGSSSC
jgi:Transposase